MMDTTKMTKAQLVKVVQAMQEDNVPAETEPDVPVTVAPKMTWKGTEFTFTLDCHQKGKLTESGGSYMLYSTGKRGFLDLGNGCAGIIKVFRAKKHKII